jgi:signal transduction histidine kinase
MNADTPGQRRTPFTLRHRLLLVYLIVVLLSVATVGVAMFELSRSRQIIREMQDWNRIVRRIDALRVAFNQPLPFTIPQTFRDELDEGKITSSLRSRLAEHGIFIYPEATLTIEEPGHQWRISDHGRNYTIVEEEQALHVYQPAITGSRQEVYFADLIPQQYLELARAPAYLDVDELRRALNAVQIEYSKWLQLDPEERRRQMDMVRAPLDDLALVVQAEVGKLDFEIDMQDIRKNLLLIAVGFLTFLHVVVIGSLLRRWLLWPMEQLNRQVDALARDEPPPEPLLTQPYEMANLAEALDRARRSLGVLRQKLIETERLTTIGQFAAQLAHNLRNPLASIRAAAQLTGRRLRDDDETVSRMDEIITSVDRLNRWIAGLMEIARREPTLTREADVVPVLHRVAEMVRPELAVKELTLHVDAPAGGLVCAHHAETLEHVLVAMITNAIEASPLHETIILRAEHIEGDDGEAAACRISVIDHGRGLPEGEPDQIFEFSFSTKQRGMGLGLALARQALQRQGGRAGARNNPQVGATVFVELPAEPDGPMRTREG